MTRNQFTFFVVLSLGIVFIITNPKEEDHKAVLKSKLTKILQNGIAKENKSGDLYNIIGRKMGLLAGNYIVDEVIDNVCRDNYFLFSTTNITWDGEEEKVGIGFLGNIFLTSQFDDELNKFLENRNTNKSNSDKSITGQPKLLKQKSKAYINNDALAGKIFSVEQSAINDPSYLNRKVIYVFPPLPNRAIYSYDEENDVESDLSNASKVYSDYEIKNNSILLVQNSTLFTVDTLQISIENKNIVFSTHFGNITQKMKLTYLKPFHM